MGETSSTAVIGVSENTFECPLNELEEWNFTPVPALADEDGNLTIEVPDYEWTPYFFILDSKDEHPLALLFTAPLPQRQLLTLVGFAEHATQEQVRVIKELYFGRLSYPRWDWFALRPVVDEIDRSDPRFPFYFLRTCLRDGYKLEGNTTGVSLLEVNRFLERHRIRFLRVLMRIGGWL